MRSTRPRSARTAPTSSRSPARASAPSHIVSGTPLVVGNGFTVRYTVAGQFAAAGGAVTVTFNGRQRGRSWRRAAPPSSVTSDATFRAAPTTLGTVTGVSVPTFELDGQALDITFAVPDGATIDAASIAGFTGSCSAAPASAPSPSTTATRRRCSRTATPSRTGSRARSRRGDVTVAVGPGSFTVQHRPGRRLVDSHRRRHEQPRRRRHGRRRRRAVRRASAPTASRRSTSVPGRVAERRLRDRPGVARRDGDHAQRRRPRHGGDRPHRRAAGRRQRLRRPLPDHRRVRARTAP